MFSFRYVRVVASAKPGDLPDKLTYVQVPHRDAYGNETLSTAITPIAHGYEESVKKTVFFFRDLVILFKVQEPLTRFRRIGYRWGFP